VVPPGEGWTYPPFGAQVVDAVLYGRGAAVSKSDMATYTFALLALDAAAEHLSGSVELHFTFDEEIGGLIGPLRLLDEGVVKPDFCISAGLSYSVVTTHNGCLHLAVTLHGKSAHAAAPHTGCDALEAANQVLSALYAERANYPLRVSAHPGIGHPNLTVGLIAGGINTNVVPDKVTLRLDRRIIPEERPEVVEAHLRYVIAKAADLPGIRVEIERVLLAAPLKELPGVETLIEPLQRYGREFLGAELATEGVPLYTDSRLYTDAGIPTVVYGAGPRSFLEANGHRADEKVRLSDFDAATRIVELFKQDRERITEHSDRVGSALRVHDLFQQTPYLTGNQIVHQTGLSAPTVNAALADLERLGVLEEVTGRKRGRVFSYRSYLAILSEGTAPLPSTS